MNFILTHGQIVRHVDGGIDRVVAQVPTNGDLELAGLLVAQANLADRDEQLLDELAAKITSRNESQPAV